MILQKLKLTREPSNSECSGFTFGKKRWWCAHTTMVALESAFDIPIEKCRYIWLTVYAKAASNRVRMRVAAEACDCGCDSDILCVTLGGHRHETHLDPDDPDARPLLKHLDRTIWLEVEYEEWPVSE